MSASEAASWSYYASRAFASTCCIVAELSRCSDSCCCYYLSNCCCYYWSCCLAVKENAKAAEQADDSWSDTIDSLSSLDLLNIRLSDCNIAVLYRWQLTTKEREKHYYCRHLFFAICTNNSFILFLKCCFVLKAERKLFLLHLIQA